MAITFTPARTHITPFSRKKVHPITSSKILEYACTSQFEKCLEILQSSFPPTSVVRCYSNGFVHTVTEAYNQHRVLVIRPDDVWLAILTQFNFFVNANSERLRAQFVQNHGTKQLDVEAGGTRYSADFGQMAKAMTREIERNVVDPNLRSWITPSFTTTTQNDTIVCSMVMMATMKSYFPYKFSLRCGIPRVTMEGEQSDWLDILHRLEKLKDFGLQTTAWYHLLVPVITRFVSGFEDPHGLDNIDFWGKVVHYEGGGSGPTYLGGWLSAFCVFDAQGNWLGNTFINNDEPTQSVPIHFSAQEFSSTYMCPNPEPPFLTLDSASYHQIDTQDIPPAFAECDVKLDDNGELFDCVLTAGFVGHSIGDSGPAEVDGRQTGVRDLVRPVSGWWMFIKGKGG